MQSPLASHLLQKILYLKNKYEDEMNSLFRVSEIVSSDKFKLSLFGELDTGILRLNSHKSACFAHRYISEHTCLCDKAFCTVVSYHYKGSVFKCILH